MGSSLTRFLALACAALLLNGCAILGFKSPEEKFVGRIDAFGAELLDQEPDGVSLKGPAAALSAALLREGTSSRLEDYTLERLTLLLRQDHELYTLSRENLGQLRDGRPLLLADHPGDRQRKSEELLIYQVAAGFDEVLKQVTLRGTLLDALGREVPGVFVEARFDAEELPAAMSAQLRERRNFKPQDGRGFE